MIVYHPLPPKVGNLQDKLCPVNLNRLCKPADTGKLVSGVYTKCQ